MIRHLNRQLGYTFVIIEHDMDLIASLCERVIVLAEGSVLTEGPMDAVRRDPRVIDAYLGGGEDGGAPPPGPSNGAGARPGSRDGVRSAAAPEGAPASAPRRSDRAPGASGRSGAGGSGDGDADGGGERAGTGKRADRRMKPEPPILELDRVTGGYGGAEVIHEVSITLGRSEVVTLIGPNGPASRAR